LLPFSGRLVTRLLVLVHALYSIAWSIAAPENRLKQAERAGKVQDAQQHAVGVQHAGPLRLWRTTGAKWWAVLDLNQ